jgi:sarcosine oxidase subunit beta
VTRAADLTRVADVVVVGGGLEGLSIAWALTRAGIADVVVCERATLASGETGKSSGIVRCHYGVASLAWMAWKGIDLFENAADALGTEIGFVQTGYVVGVGPENAGALAANVADHRALGIDVDLVDPDAVAHLWPGVDPTGFAGFAYEPRGGYGDAYRTATAYAAAARRGGATIYQHAPVARVTADGDRVTGVDLVGGGHVAAPAVVVAAGWWSSGLVAPLGIDLPLRAQREPILLVEASSPVRGVPVLSDLVSLQYVRPERSGQLLVGNSNHWRPDFVPVPEGYLNRATDGEVETLGSKLVARLPGLRGLALSGSYAGCYDVTPDYNPVIDRAGPDGLVIAAGFSGHGFKISAAVGDLVADLLITGGSRDPWIPASDFRLARFAEGRPLVSAHPYRGAGTMR